MFLALKGLHWVKVSEALLPQAALHSSTTATSRTRTQFSRGVRRKMHKCDMSAHKSVGPDSVPACTSHNCTL